MAESITEATLNDIYPQYKVLREAKKGFAYPTKEHNAEKAIDQLSICASQGLNFIAKKDLRIVGCMVLCYDQLKKARELGLPLHMSVTYGTDVERKEKYFLRQGFEKIGGNYLLR